jgi:hypothetical protein
VEAEEGCVLDGFGLAEPDATVFVEAVSPVLDTERGAISGPVP